MFDVSITDLIAEARKVFRESAGWDLGIQPGTPLDLVRRLADALESVTAPTKPPVHNHGPAEGRGLDCNESVVGGFLQGACMRVTEQTDPFSQSPHMASKYWAELVKARKRIAELEAAVTAPTEGELEYGLIGHVDDEIPVFETRKFAENELANQIARLQREADPDPPPVLFQRVKRGPWVEVSS